MPAFYLIVITLGAFYLGYRFYSKYLAERVYALDPNFKTPSHEFSDGVDFVPTNKHILLGHHFTAVAGAAPIVGPAIAVYWGWLPAIAWVILGTIFGAGVHDFGAIVTSARNRGQNIGTLSGKVISARASTLFLLIIFFLLTLVNAVFGVVMAILFQAHPGSVIPAVIVIPIAMCIGQWVYRMKGAVLIPSIIGLVLLYAAIPVGQAYPIHIDGLANLLGLSVRTTWIILIFAYTWFASRLPVWLLLQPRDYINGQQLLVALVVIFAGVIVGWDQIVAPAVNHVAADTKQWFPYLFITIACGAISGFHSLVASGTTSKQIDKETDARYIGYCGSLGEGSLALAAILACTAGLGSAADWSSAYSSFGAASGGALGHFVDGVGHFLSNLGIDAQLGASFAVVVVVTFAGTTMDTGVRLQRYILEEIAELAGFRSLVGKTTVLTTLAVVIPLALALVPGGDSAGGKGFAFGQLWTLFGTTNQLTAGLALSVISVWVMSRNRNPLAAIVPLTFLLFMTSWALVLNLISFLQEGSWMLLIMDAAIAVLTAWLIVEAVTALNRQRGERRAEVADES
ncbi:carbon starvation CstA family protein [Salinisphaera hydrothermalis]|uniref:Carbon starvation protein A n=1 Tax=Salinisphaera hydrothermalis (strain C41B8) TaxID=1304275 RepID=A0A084IGT7_SALHC|nr:carbon starvation protein A [Salinisphaera hydrothermalis]KEZ75921.1 carbon starvation protein A [Salinisphaera hydrothermalis C41B8]